MEWPWKYIPRNLLLAKSYSALRSVFKDSFFGRPAIQATGIDYNLARSLYRNDHIDYFLGSGFVRPIIDLSTEYIGLPYVTSDDGDRDTFLNECIHDYWAPQLQEVWRDAMRDSKTVIRFRQPRIDNPLFTEEDRIHGRIEVIPPEMADISYDPTDPDLVERAVITHFINVDERTTEELLRGDAPRVEEHEVHEVITQDEYRFYDKTDDKELVSWRTPNPQGFVPTWEVWNDYDAAIGGGQSDIEPIMPFIQAFHQVLEQALKAHKYHSTPKIQFQLKDVYSFLSNNYPEAIDETTGKVKPGATINFTGGEVLLFNTEEGADFIEAKSVLGDSKTLLDFLIDCISIASETPKWALLKSEAVNATDAGVQPFEKKIDRKRVMFSQVIIMVCKMALASRNQSPVTMRVTWPTIKVTDLAAKGQAIQQIIMAFDVATQHQWIADATVIQILGTLFPEVSSPAIERTLAANNVVPELPAPAPQSDTQAANSNGNGGGSKAAAQRALATTKASNS